MLIPMSGSPFFVMLLHGRLQSKSIHIFSTLFKLNTFTAKCYNQASVYLV